MYMAINFDRMEMYSKEFSSIKSPDPLVSWSCEVTWNILDVVSLLPQGLWTLNLVKWWFNLRNLSPFIHTTLWTSGRVRSCDELKRFYINYRNTSGHQIWHGGYIQWGLSFCKNTWPFHRMSIVTLISLT